MPEIVPIPIYEDNYVWLIVYQGSAWVIDPGEHTAVIAALEQRRLSLKGILVTHHHWDHINGIKPLQLHFASKALPVYGPSHSLHKVVNHPVGEGDQIALANLTLKVLATPGHTADHLSYWLEEENILFCGDTLFNCGCGRLFDGTIEQLFHAHQRLKAFPAETAVYCSHEYTLANIRFARAVDPSNRDLIQWEKHCQNELRKKIPSIPFSLGEQMKLNPFLRTDQAAIQHSLQKKFGELSQTSSELEYFSCLRQWKDHF